MRILNYIPVLTVLLFSGTGCRSTRPTTYVLEEQGRSTWRVMFDKKMPTSAEQWKYARETQKKGWLKKADRRMLYLVRRWPNSKEAPWAQRARADMLFARGKLKDAFKAYQYLIDGYSSRMLDYDTVLQSQFEIARQIMEKKRMPWMLGGYKAPEYAVEHFEAVIRNGPQWRGAPEAQFLIGRCNEDANELELAVSAYGVLGYRYPDSKFAEEAALRRILCLNKLRKEFPNSPEMIDRTLTATTVFLTTFPTSKHKTRITLLRNELYEIMAGKVFDQAEFYAKVPKEADAAIRYYQHMIDEFPKSELVPVAKERIAELRRIMAMPREKKEQPMRSKPLFGKDGSNGRG